MSDLIDRKAVLGAILELARERFSIGNWYEIYLKALHEVIDVIGTVPSAQPMQWIPCREETPKENGFYLLSSGGTVLIAYYSYGEWLSELPLIMTENNTAWMPLPTPYGGERMSNLIDRRSAIESIRECAEDAHDNREWDMEQGYLNAIECIEEEPSAQPEIDNLHPKVDPNFSSCSHCVHSEDSEEICILRRCVHAIAELKECYKERRQDD